MIKWPLYRKIYLLAGCLRHLLLELLVSGTQSLMRWSPLMLELILVLRIQILWAQLCMGWQQSSVRVESSID